MIIRILHEGQYDVPARQLDRLNELDSDLQAAVDDEDESVFRQALADLLAEVRRSGELVPDGVLTASDLVLPAEGATLSEVASLLGDEGLIPG